MLIDEQFNLTLVLRGWERAYDPNLKNAILIEGGFWISVRTNIRIFEYFPPNIDIRIRFVAIFKAKYYSNI